MSITKKYIIQILDLLIFSIILFRVWNNYDVKMFYVQLLALSQILIEFLYLIFNKNKLKQEEKGREYISIGLFLLAILIINLFRLLSKV